MKIGIITEIINYHSGSRAPLEIAKHLAKLNQDVTVYAYNVMLDNNARRDLIASGVKVAIINKPDIGQISKIPASISLIKMLRHDKPDIATFSGTPPFFFAAKLSGIPVVRIYQGSQFDAYLEKKSPSEKLSLSDKLLNLAANILIYLIEISSYRLANGVVAISKSCAKEGEKYYRRKVDKIIYHGTSKLPRTAKSESSSNTAKLISVSRITPYKGFHLIIEAIKLLKDPVHLTIAGSQPKPKYIKYLKKIGGNNLKIVIDPTDHELSKLYSSSDIYVNADRYLYFGLPITEAASFGLPSVSFDFAAAKELVIHGKTGFIASSPMEFAARIEKLTKNSKLREKMGQEAKKRAQEFFTWSKAAKEYLTLFKKTISLNEK